VSNNQLSCTGTLVAGPGSSTDGTFPAGSTTIPFATNPDPKPASASTGDQVVNVNNPSFAALPGVGAGGVVTQGTFLFIRTLGTMQVRTTTYNVNGNVQAVEVINGFKAVEFDPGAYLVMLEVLGNGQVEYFVSGPQ
jgi:hypothetical protein